MRRLILAATLCLAASAAVRGQEAPPEFPRYCEAVRQYASGRREAAMVIIEAWPVANLRRAAALTTRCTGPASAALAVSLLTDLAIHRRSTSASEVAQYLNVAESSVAMVKPDDLRDHTAPGVARFQADWSAVAGHLMIAWTNPQLAAHFVDRALHRFNDSAALHTLAGMDAEMRIHIGYPNLHDRIVVDAAPRSNGRAPLLEAESEFRRAIALDEAAFDARVHLGRVLFLIKRPHEAREMLATVASNDAAPAAWRHLAHLFIGAVAEFEYDTNEARREYEAALAVRPSQTASVALSFVERATGHEARSRELIEAWASAPPPDEDLDPFSAHQNGSFELERMDALRAQVAR